MKGDVPINVLNDYLSMGFQQELIQMAWTQVENQNSMMDTLINLNEKNQKMLEESVPGDNKHPAGTDDDVLLNQIIMDSLVDAKHSIASFETMNPEQRKRQDGVPVGLKNVGNTCYFNSLLQSYFFNCEFVRRILSFLPPPEFLQSQKEKDSKLIDQKTKNAIQLVLNLQALFVSMIGSNKKYVDPTDVVKAICDDFGNHLPIGDQKDAGEFNNYFLSHVEEGLSYTKKSNQDSQMHDEGQIQQSPDRQLNNQSLLRQKSSVVSQESLISKLFFGKVKQTFVYRDHEGNRVQRETDELFNSIPLDVRHKDLYDAWDHWCVADIDDYKNDNGENISATKYTWLKSPPETLFFQIQRVVYDKDRLDLVKLNDQFKFDKELYADRFLYENQITYLNIRKSVLEVKKKQQEYESHMNQLKSFNGSFNLLDGIKQTAEFLNLQTQQANDQNPLLCSQKIPQQDLLKVVQILQNYNTEINNKYNDYQTKYQQLEDQIQQSYNNLKKEKYHLQSIQIHDGSASSGHYYSYVYDTCQSKWLKFNDIHVTQQEEAIVMRDAIGGHSHTNAYLLTYVRQDIVNRELSYMQPLRTYKLNTHLQNDPDMYHSFLTHIEREQLRIENELYMQEIDDYKAARCLDGILDQYQRRFEFVNEQSRLLKVVGDKQRFKPPYLLNSAIFVKNHPDNINNRYDNIVKWLILDCSVRDLHPNKISLLHGQGNDQFADKLKNKLKAQLSEFKSPRFPITQSDQQLCIRLTQEYYDNVILAANTIYLLDSYTHFRWIPALMALNTLANNIQQQKLDQKGYFYKMCNNKLRLMSVSIIFFLEDNAKTIPEQNVCDLLGVFVAFLNQKYPYFKETQMWKVQISILLNDLTVAYESSKLIMERIRQLQVTFDNDIINHYDEQFLTNAQPDYTQHLQLYQNEYEPYSWSLNKKEDEISVRLTKQFDEIQTQFKSSIDFLKKLKDAKIPIMLYDRKAKQQTK